MAVFEYRCQVCESKFDVLHLGKEKQEDIVCPQCKSTNHKKLLSVFSASSGTSSTADMSSVPSCASGACGIGGGCFN